MRSKKEDILFDEEFDKELEKLEQDVHTLLSADPDTRWLMMEEFNREYGEYNGNKN